MRMRRDVLMTIIGIAVGTLIGWAITHVYYLKAIDDMKADAKERNKQYDQLQHSNQLMLRGIESIGTIKYDRDAAGNVRGVVIELKGSAIGSPSACGTLSAGDGK